MGGRLDPALAAVRHAVRRCCADIEPGRHVIVACSGGADSTALAAAAGFEARAAGWALSAAVVDHRLQQSSGEVALDVSRRLADLGYDDVEIQPVDVVGPGGPEAAARAARYDALSALAARDDAVVLLGHTRDDQAETVLLGLVRGSGLRSLAGMPAVRGPFRRPLLQLSRAETTRACAALGLVPWQDPHNDDERYVRVRIRHHVLPTLEDTLGPGVAEALARTADLARDDADALDTMAAELAASAHTGSGGLSVQVLSVALPALRRRVLRRWAVAAGAPAGQLSAVHIVAIERLVTDWHGQTGVDVPGRLAVRRVAGELVVSGRLSTGAGMEPA